MPGLDYGHTYRKPKRLKEGVSQADRTGKWLVRLKQWNGNISTKAQFDTKEEADEHYKKIKIRKKLPLVKRRIRA